MKSEHSALPHGDQHLQMYVVNRDEFEHVNVKGTEDDLYITSSPLFLRSKPQERLGMYQEAITAAVQSPHPVITTHPDSQGKPVFMIAHRVGAPSNGHGQMAEQSNVHSARHLRTVHRILDRLGLDVKKKYADTFSNGVRRESCSYQYLDWLYTHGHW